jgi:hypothetical protein
MGSFGDQLKKLQQRKVNQIFKANFIHNNSLRMERAKNNATTRYLAGTHLLRG